MLTPCVCVWRACCHANAVSVWVTAQPAPAEHRGVGGQEVVAAQQPLQLHVGVLLRHGTAMVIIIIIIMIMMTIIMIVKNIKYIIIIIVIIVLYYYYYYYYCYYSYYY